MSGRRFHVPVAIWRDPAFTGLTRGAQLLWFYATGLSKTGAVTAARISRKGNWDRGDVEKAWAELSKSKYGGILANTAPKRRRMPRSVSAAVFARDHHRCLRCNTDERLTVDHIWPVSRGGSDDLENLQTLCQSCNSRKGARVDADQIDQARVLAQ
jgi:hypothetical protein